VRPWLITGSPHGACCPAGLRHGSWRGLALGLLAIIVITGRPTPAARPAPLSQGEPAAPNPDRLRDYQDRLRVLDERSRQQAQVDAVPPAAPVLYENGGTARVDPLQQEKRRREYESLFASNVVMSRRTDGQKPLLTGDRTPSARAQGSAAEPPSPPSLDEVAAAVVRATSRSTPAQSAPAARGQAAVQDNQPQGNDSRSQVGPTAPISASGPTHRLLEGTIIDAG